VQDQIRSRFRELVGESRPDTSGSAGHYDDLVREVESGLTHLVDGGGFSGHLTSSS
jgi:hypothetical protein